MATNTKAGVTGMSMRRVLGTIVGVFGLIATLAVIAYTIAITLVDWVAISVLSYPVAGVAPFIVITAAILTIPIIVPTVFVSAKRLGGS